MTFVSFNCLFNISYGNLLLLSTELVVALDTQKITVVSSGRGHSVVINEQGQVFAWGAGEGGQLGLGTTETVVRIPRWFKLLDKTNERNTKRK